MYQIDKSNELYINRPNSAEDEEFFKQILTDRERFKRLMAYYRCAIKEVETKFRVLDEEYSLLNDRNPICSIRTRLKSIPSIIEKLQRRGLNFTFDSLENDLFDIAGIRVVCSFVQDVYKLCDALLSQDDIELLEMKDYIKNPKANGYRSLHLIIVVPIFLEKEKKMMKVEIQLRTIAMDCWATLEHQLRYKKGKEVDQEMHEALNKCARLAADLDDEMDILRFKNKI